MQITIKNIKRGYLKTFKADDLDAFQNVLTQLRDYSLESAANSSFELDLIAIDEIINSFELAKLKALSEKHHIDYLKIYSNNSLSCCSLSLSIIELKFLFNCLNSSSVSSSGTLTSNAPLLIESDAPIKFMIGFVSFDAKVIAIEVDKNNSNVTTII